MALQQIKPVSARANRTAFQTRDAIRKIRSLGETDARLLYELLVKASLKEPIERGEISRKLAPPNTIRRNPQKLRIWRDASESLASLVSGQERREVWELYECLLTDNHAKLLGQYFTPGHVAKFALSGLVNVPTALLDPMVGHGVFLLEARRRFPSTRLVGVEIDSLPLAAARLVLDDSATLVCADVFDWAAKNVARDAHFGFPVIVGNPAYVSYQTLDQVQDFAKKKTPGRARYGEWLLSVLKEIAESKGLSTELTSLFKAWSGLSDLSMYVLTLAWLLAEPDGQIAFVMSNHWMERDYGRALRQFLSSHGTIRGIITHRAGKWFPRAQIPASIFVYTKGKVSERQNSKGIPYVEIDTPYLEDIENYLTLTLRKSFWQWLDSVAEPASYGSLHVSFREWTNHEDEKNLPSAVRTLQTLILPSGFGHKDWISLDEAGWNVHQGLRTGCNEFFYIERDDRTNGSWIATRTRGGKKEQVSLRIPDELLIPTIKRIPATAPFAIGKEHADVYLLALTESITPEDKEYLQQYPKDWLKAWHTEEMNVLSDQVAHHISEWGATPYEGKGKVKGPVSSLSAVKTNAYMPPLKQSTGIPRPPRFWYQVPIQPRHFARIILPRVSSSAPRAFLVKDSETLLIDANFSTLNSKSNAIGSKRMWVWFNSNTFRALSELNGVPMGGGALKLEALLLSQLPVAKAIRDTGESIFDRLSQLLEGSATGDEQALHIGSIIDAELFGLGISQSNLKTIKGRMKQRMKSP